MNRQRLIVITGVTRGLGRALAEGFAAAGHRVAGCGRNADAINTLSRALPSPHRFTTVDVTDDAAVSAWAAGVLESLGAPDLLLNNAALIARNAPLWELSAEEVAAVFDVNLKGVVNVLRHFVPAMIERDRGVIVNFSSGWGRSVNAEVAPYCATKFGIEGLTQALALELPPTLAAIPLNPGVINTDMLRSCFGSSADAYPSPAEWARRAVPFLLQLGPQHTGRSLSVSGTPLD